MGLKIIFYCNFFFIIGMVLFFTSVTFQKCSNNFCFLVYALLCTIIAMDTQTNDVTQAVSKFASDLYTVNIELNFSHSTKVE